MKTRLEIDLVADVAAASVNAWTRVVYNQDGKSNRKGMLTFLPPF
jgi:hypothetical protein